MSFVDFLSARISEDEAGLDCGVNSHDGATSIDSPTSLTCGCDFRAKRECRSKRRMLDLHSRSEEHEPGHTPGRFCEACAEWSLENGEGQPPTVPWPCQTLRLVCAVYSDHPEYIREWRPDV